MLGGYKDSTSTFTKACSEGVGTAAESLEAGAEAELPKAEDSSCKGVGSSAIGWAEREGSMITPSVGRALNGPN